VIEAKRIARPDYAEESAAAAEVFSLGDLCLRLRDLISSPNAPRTHTKRLNANALLSEHQRSIESSSALAAALPQAPVGCDSRAARKEE
jgi:hypothetical protein